MEKTIQDVLTRLEKLESAVFSSAKPFTANSGIKTKTLPELVRGKIFKNGQEKVAMIIGYREHGVGMASGEDDIKVGWREAKFVGRFAHTLLSRAVADGLISNYGKKGEYVLTQTGESFYQSITQ